MSKKKREKWAYVTVLLFILYSIWVHVESQKYKIICLKSTKSSEFAKKNPEPCWFNWLIFKNREIKKNKKLRLRWDSNPQPLGLMLWNTCAIGCSKKTAENVFKEDTNIWNTISNKSLQTGQFELEWHTVQRFAFMCNFW